MNFLEFSKLFNDARVIDIRNVITCFNGFDRRRLYEWQKRGLLFKVASNFYITSAKPPDDRVLRSVASRIYAPRILRLSRPCRITILFLRLFFGRSVLQPGGTS